MKKRDKVYTVEGQFNVREDKKIANDEYAKRLRGLPLDAHVQDHIAGQPKYRITKDKHEDVKGGTLDDFVGVSHRRRR